MGVKRKCSIYKKVIFHKRLFPATLSREILFWKVFSPIFNIISEKNYLDKPVFNNVNRLKVGISPSTKEVGFICFNESPLKIMNNVSYVILRALFVLKIFKFFS